MITFVLTFVERNYEIFYVLDFNKKSLSMKLLHKIIWNDFFQDDWYLYQPYTN